MLVINFPPRYPTQLQNQCLLTWVSLQTSGGGFLSLILATGDLGKAGHAECLKELSWSEGHIGRHPWLEAGGAVACLFFAGLQGGVWPVFLLAFFFV